jgi:hypothetical protein
MICFSNNPVRANDVRCIGNGDTLPQVYLFWSPQRVRRTRRIHIVHGRFVLAQRNPGAGRQTQEEPTRSTPAVRDRRSFESHASAVPVRDSRTIVPLTLNNNANVYSRPRSCGRHVSHLADLTDVRRLRCRLRFDHVYHDAIPRLWSTLCRCSCVGFVKRLNQRPERSNTI